MYANESGIIYKVTEGVTYSGNPYTIKEAVGPESYTEETDTEIVTYAFDLEQGTYIEQSRQPKTEG